MNLLLILFIGSILCSVVVGWLGLYVYYSLRPTEARMVQRTKGAYGGLGLDQDFVHNFALWKSGTIETLLFGITVKDSLSCPGVAEEDKETLNPIVMKHFHSNECLFSSKPLGKPTMSSTHCGIGVIKIARGISPSDQLSSVSFEESSKVVSAVESFLHQSMYCADIAEVFSANSILWNLGSKLDSSMTNSIAEYIESLWRESGCGYAVRSIDDKPCVSATHFSVKLLKRLGMIESLSPKRRKDLKRFLLSCQDPYLELFSGRTNQTSNILHTRMALEIRATLDLEFDINRVRLDRAIRACSHKYGVAFAPGLVPNIYALGNTLAILRKLDNLQKGDGAIDKGLANLNFTRHSINALVDSAYVVRKGSKMQGIRGYPQMPLADQPA